MHWKPVVYAPALALLACASTTRLYSGPARAPAEVVHMSVRPSVAKGLSLNGSEVSGYSFELEPGPIAVQFEIRRHGYGSMTTVSAYAALCRASFEGQAGQRYRIDGGQQRGGARAYVGEAGELENRHVLEQQILLVGWVENLETGNRVEANCESF